jgi:hypothetical protein
LGRLAGLNHPGLVVKKISNWTSIYSSAPIVPAALLREIARVAGCHIYSDGNDVVYANRDYLGIYMPAGGSRTIHLPATSDVTDLLTNQKLGQGEREFAVKEPPNTTLLLKMTRSVSSGQRHAEAH